MNEIIQRLAEKTGLSEDKASAAVDTIMGFLKEKLPAPIASQIESVMSGGAGAGGEPSGVAAGLTGMFGKKE